MEVRVKATGYDITPEVTEYINDKAAAIEKLLASDAPLARCEVEVGRVAGNQRHGEHVWYAEFNVNYPGGATVHVSNHESTVNAAIDMAKDEAVRQLRKSRQAHTTFIRKSGSAIKNFLRFGGE